MRADLCTIARYGTDRGLRMVMGTSGYFLDHAMAARLRDAGIRAVAVSIDSADPAVHDSFQGVSGALEKAVQGIKNCRDEGKPREHHPQIGSSPKRSFQYVSGVSSRLSARSSIRNEKGRFVQ